MDSVRSFVASHGDTRESLSALASELAGAAANPALVFTFYGCGHDDALIHQFLTEKYPGAALIGGSSSGGLMTDRGFTGPESIGLLMLEDASGDYGVASSAFDGDPEASARRTLARALEDCGCAGQLPNLIWVYQSPGNEEAVIRGLRSVVGDHCPIMGGSAADNDVSGKWRLLGPDGPLCDGLVVAVLFPSSPIGFAFQGGYEPSGPNGTVTGVAFRQADASGIVTGGAGREIVSIDGEPAAAVYNRWAEGAIEAKLSEGGSVLAETTMFPLAIEAGSIDGVGQFLLIHPESVTPEGSLKTFREVEVGMHVHAMRGDRRQLVARAGRVAEQARRNLQRSGEDVAGAIMIYCGGCKLAIDGDITNVADTVRESLDGAPYIGCFTFGEQGFLIDRNVHGNLMISAVVFGR